MNYECEKDYIKDEILISEEVLNEITTKYCGVVKSFQYDELLYNIELCNDNLIKTLLFKLSNDDLEIFKKCLAFNNLIEKISVIKASKIN